MILYSLVYVITIMKLLFLENKFKIINLFLFFYLALIIGFRSSGIDYENFSYGTTGNEFIFATFVSLYKYMGFSFSFFLLTFACISIGLKFYFIKNYANFVMLSILLFMSLLLIKEIGQIRLAMSISILWISILPLVERKFYIYFLIVLVASSIQIFALAALPLYVLFPYLNKQKISTILLMISIFIFSMNIDIVHFIINFFDGYLLTSVESKLLGYYTNRELHSFSFNIFNIFIYIVVPMFKEKVIQNKFQLGLWVSYNYSLIMYFLLGTVATIAGRSLEMFGFGFLILVLPNLINISKNKHIKYMIYILLLLFITLLYMKFLWSLS